MTVKPDRPMRGAAVSIIERMPGPGEPFFAGPILDLATVTATEQALREVVARKDLDIPHMEVLAAKLGTPGTDYELNAMKRRRDLVWNAAEFFGRLGRMLQAEVAPR